MIKERNRINALAALCAMMLCVASTANAAPRFIAESKVETGAVYSEITLRFRCNVHYVSHDPTAQSSILSIRLEPTTVCTGAPPTVALTKELHRPMGAEDALVDVIEYDGEAVGSEFIRVSFRETVRYEVRPSTIGNTLTIRVFSRAAETVAVEPAETRATDRVSQRVTPDSASVVRYVINLESSMRRPAAADLPTIAPPAGTSLLVSEVSIDGKPWYRVQIGHFDSAADAARAMRDLRSEFPGAWIAHAGESGQAVVPAIEPVAAQAVQSGENVDADEVAQLMTDARRAMTAGELSRAVQLYTKVLQLPANDYQQDAQEYLALARERNGQLAHAKAEYRRYLDVYPDTPGADRVQQRLAALLSTGAAPRQSADGTPGRPAGGAGGRSATPWTLRTFVSQYYRRDVNQVNDQDEVVNQSSIYTDANIDARRRGERFDLAMRVTAGYRSNLLSEDEVSTSGNDLRLSYAYVDLADAGTSLRGRLGRQTRSTGGVLGRFDGLNLSYDLLENLRLEAVAGRPVYSTSDDFEDSRFFKGISTTYTPFDNALDVGAFFLQQDVEGLTDRSAVGAEVRYFGERRSLWGMVSYDTEFAELGSIFVQGTWRSENNLTLTGQVDVRRSPYLSLGNALVGQQVESFSDLMVLFTADELRQFALDRSPEVTTVSAGVSRPLTPKLQFNVNASHSAIAATPESGAVAATEESEYSYFSADLVSSGMFVEGDVAILGFRYSVSDTTDVYSINLDSRFPIGRSWRINPRLRVDYREISSDQSTQWIYSPSLRLQFRVGRRWRFELETGMQFSERDMETTNMDRQSNFVHLGYQLFF
jgi:tetratricopeptide (TPR) repeat protein